MDVWENNTGLLRCTCAYVHDTIWDAILICAQKPTRVSLIDRTEPTTKKWKTEKILKSEKTDIVRSIGKQSESVESVRNKKKKATIRRICRKAGFKRGMQEWRDDGWWGWWVDGADRISAIRRTGWVRIGDISAWLTERSRKSILRDEEKHTGRNDRIIRGKDDVDGRASVTKDKKRVLQWGWTVISCLCRYEGWVFVRTFCVSQRSLYSMRSVIFSQCIDRSDGSDVTGFGNFDNSTCKRVLDLLEPGDVTLGQVAVKRVAVVKLRVKIEMAMVEAVFVSR